MATGSAKLSTEVSVRGFREANHHVDLDMNRSSLWLVDQVGGLSQRNTTLGLAMFDLAVSAF
jgi:hypothetical protein